MSRLSDLISLECDLGMESFKSFPSDSNVQQSLETNRIDQRSPRMESGRPAKETIIEIQARDSGGLDQDG